MTLVISNPGGNIKFQGFHSILLSNEVIVLNWVLDWLSGEMLRRDAQERCSGEMLKDG